MNRKFLGVKPFVSNKFIKPYSMSYSVDGKEYLYHFISRHNEDEVKKLSMSGDGKGDAVVFLPYYEENGETFVVFINEFKYALNKYIIGLPAGLIDEGETVNETIKREAVEEIGGIVNKIDEVSGILYASAGITDETNICAFVKLKGFTKQMLQGEEDIKVLRVNVKDIPDFLNKNKDNCSMNCELMARYFHAKHSMIIGAFVGKFLPPHIGHKSVIDLGLQICDELHVVISENPKYTEKLTLNAGLKPMPAKLRREWILEEYDYNPRLKVDILDETGLKPFPEDLDKWSERFKETVRKDLKYKFGDITYKELNEKYFPECKYIDIDRKNSIKISGTMIRENPEKYKDSMFKAARDYLEK